MTTFLGYDSEGGFVIRDAEDEQSASIMMNQDSVVLGKLNKNMIKGMLQILTAEKAEIQTIVNLWGGCIEDVYLFPTRKDAEKAYEEIIMNSGDYKSVEEYETRLKDGDMLDAEPRWFHAKLGEKLHPPILKKQKT